MGELVGGEPAPGATDRILVGDLAQRHEQTHVRQHRQRAFIIATACGDLGGQRLVLRRQAFDRIEDHAAGEPEVVVDPLGIAAFGQAVSAQGLVEQDPGMVAGERPPGAVGAEHAGREADEREPGTTVAERRHRRVPPAGISRAQLVP